MKFGCIFDLLSECSVVNRINILSFELLSQMHFSFWASSLLFDNILVQNAIFDTLSLTLSRNINYMGNLILWIWLQIWLPLRRIFTICILFMNLLLLAMIDYFNIMMHLLLLAKCLKLSSHLNFLEKLSLILSFFEAPFGVYFLLELLHLNLVNLFGVFGLKFRKKTLDFSPFLNFSWIGHLWEPPRGYRCLVPRHFIIFLGKRCAGAKSECLRESGRCRIANRFKWSFTAAFLNFLFL